MRALLTCPLKSSLNPVVASALACGSWSTTQTTITAHDVSSSHGVAPNSLALLPSHCDAAWTHTRAARRSN